MESFDFYYGAASGSERKALRQLEEPNVMINYATVNNTPWSEIENLFIDSGGYSFMLGKGEYGTSNKEYLNFIEQHQPELFALRDYPCEPEVLEEHNRTVDDHLKATTEKHKELLNLMSSFNIESQPVSVIQGWELNDYLKHLKMMKNEGTLTDYVAIGSVCRRNQDQEIREIISEINDRIGDRKLHAFGVKNNVLRFENIRNNLDSADSLAYSSGSRYSRKTVSGDGSNGFRNVALHYLQFKRDINNLLKDGKKNRIKKAKNQKTFEMM